MPEKPPDLVQDLSFTLHKGRTLAIAGESLTTLAEGKLKQLRGNRIAMIFQEPMTALNPVMRIGAQLIEAIRAHEDVSKTEARKRALEAVRAVRLTEPERRLQQYPHELSGGMRQRVVIAMAIALRPDILIADEPTTALDVTVQREVLDLLRDLARDMNTALILITHDMGVVAEMADDVLVMQRRQMVERAPVRKLISDPDQPYTRQLLAAVPRMGQGHGAHPDTGIAPLVSLREARVAYDLHGGLLGRLVQRVHAVEAVSFDIYSGETFALVGESGCGKSTIARALAGLVPHTGDIRFQGKPLGHDAASRKQVSRELQMVFQDPMAALNERMTAGDLVREPLVIHRIGTAASRREKAAALFARVGLGEDALDRYPHEFSGGQRQRICIARALALEPKLIIADESVSALDVSVQATVLDLLAELKREMEMSYLFISHDMAVVENIADRVAVMYLGQIVEMGTGAQIFGDPRHSYTQRLIEAVPHADPERALPSRVLAASDPPSPVRSVGDPPKVVKLVDVGAGPLVAK